MPTHSPPPFLVGTTKFWTPVLNVRADSLYFHVSVELYFAVQEVLRLWLIRLRNVLDYEQASNQKHTVVNIKGVTIKDFLPLVIQYLFAIYVGMNSGTLHYLIIPTKSSKLTLHWSTLSIRRYPPLRGVHAKIKRCAQSGGMWSIQDYGRCLLLLFSGVWRPRFSAPNTFKWTLPFKVGLADDIILYCGIVLVLRRRSRSASWLWAWCFILN